MMITMTWNWVGCTTKGITVVRVHDGSATDPLLLEIDVRIFKDQPRMTWTSVNSDVWEP